jgi:hypothetical protein
LCGRVCGSRCTRTLRHAIATARIRVCVCVHQGVIPRPALRAAAHRGSKGSSARGARMGSGKRPHDRTKKRREGRKRLQEQLQQLGCNSRSAHGSAHNGTIAAVAAAAAAAAVAALTQRRCHKDPCQDTVSKQCAQRCTELVHECCSGPPRCLQHCVAPGPQLFVLHRHLLVHRGQEV